MGSGDFALGSTLAATGVVGAPWRAAQPRRQQRPLSGVSAAMMVSRSGATAPEMTICCSLAARYDVGYACPRRTCTFTRAHPCVR
jgi:hypothetical protein